MNTPQKALSFLSGGGEMGQLTRDYTWSHTSLGPSDAWPLSLKTTLGVVLHSAFPMVLFWGPDLTCFYNDAFRPSLGRNGKHPAVGRPGREVWSDIWDFIGPLLQQVLETGEPVWFEDQLVPFYRNGHTEQIYWTFSYSPAYGDDGTIDGVFVTCTETTSKVLQVQELLESREQFRSLILEASVATCLFIGKDLRIDIANNRMLGVWGKDASVIGKPLAKAVPELVGQPFLEILDHVYETGETFQAQEAPAWLEVDGVLSQYYFDYTYTPLRNSKGEVFAIMDMAIDVTGQVQARQMLLQSERNMRNLIAKAPVAICILKGSDFVVETANDRIIEIWGKTAGQVMYKPLLEGLPELTGQGIQELLTRVFTTGETFTANALPIQLRRKGNIETIYVNFIYEAFRESDSITGIIVVAAEVTEQVQARQQIEQVVAQRTQALASANAELQRSNEELGQFAYIASHDLQEPLRKVSNFTGMLEASFGDLAVPEVSRQYLEKIKASTRRMISLIRDVLAYSQLSQAPDAREAVDLSAIVRSVVNDLELLIQDQHAVIEVGPLPVIEAIPLQMEQLLGNLVANALKYTQTGRTPVISISSVIPYPPDRWPSWRHDTSLSYCLITVRDNGIGFEQEFADRIFHIFQRLHSKSEYSGTGIGLAMCKKIVQNHHGAIRAVGEPGVGASFEILLPVSQRV